jgi:hypothetical protein
MLWLLLRLLPLLLLPQVLLARHQPQRVRGKAAQELGRRHADHHQQAQAAHLARVQQVVEAQECLMVA